MGLLDRDYYRDDRGGYFINWFRHGRVTKSLVLACAVIFLLQVMTTNGRGPLSQPNTGPITESLRLTAAEVMKGQVWRLATYGFLHTTDSLWYIAFNLVVLYFFGRELEERIGWRGFLIYFVACIIVAGLAFVGATALGLNGTNQQTMFVGSTGAVMAVLILFACQEPRYRLNLFYVVPAPIWVVVFLSLGVDAWMMVLSRPAEDGRRIALALHFASALMASLYFLRSIRLPGLGRRSERVLTRRQPRLQIHEEREPIEQDAEETPVPVAASREQEEHLEAQLDVVLAKVAQHGKSSLTPAENAILQRASEIYRKRRK